MSKTYRVGKVRARSASGSGGKYLALAIPVNVRVFFEVKRGDIFEVEVDPERRCLIYRKVEDGGAKGGSKDLK